MNHNKATTHTTRFTLIVRFTGGALEGLTGSIPTNFGHFKVGDRCNKPSGGSPYEVTEIRKN